MPIFQSCLNNAARDSRCLDDIRHACLGVSEKSVASLLSVKRPLVANDLKVGMYGSKVNSELFLSQRLRLQIQLVAPPPHYRMPLRQSDSSSL